MTPVTSLVVHEQHRGQHVRIRGHGPDRIQTHYSPIISRPPATLPLRVLVAPDKFAGTLTATEAAFAISAGWRRARPADQIALLPLADGGPGFLSAIAAAQDGKLIQRRVSGPLPGDKVVAKVLLVPSDNPAGDPRPTAYLESAQACGLDLIDPAARDPRFTTTLGVGELILAAVQEGAGCVVVGLGGSGTNDGGAGMLAAMGATARDTRGEDATDLLSAGGDALKSIGSVDLTVPKSIVAPIRLVAASDVDVQLLGEGGASLGFSRQKGAGGQQTRQLERALRQWSDVAGPEFASAPATGAAGGLGYGLALLSAEYRSGSQTVLNAVRFKEHCLSADVVITGEGRVDWQSLRGKLVGAVVEQAIGCGSTPLVLAGDSDWVSESFTKSKPVHFHTTQLHTIVGEGVSQSQAMAEPDAQLSDLAERVARDW